MPLPQDDGKAVNRSDRLLLLMLALCTVLGASTSLVTGAAAGVALLLIAVFCTLVFVPIRSFLPSALQSPAFVVIFTGLVTAADLLLRAWWPDFQREAGVFLPLAVAAAPLLASSEILSVGVTKAAAVTGALVMGIALACGTALLGGLRELVGSNVLQNGFPLALLPPGALLAMGILLAGWNAFADRGRP